MKSKSFKEKMILITYGIVLFVLLFNYSWLLSITKIMINVLVPFVVGGILAFIINVLVNTLEDKVLKKVSHQKRLISVSLSLIIVFGFLTFLLIILIPQIKNAGEIFIENLPEYKETMTSYGEKLGLSEEKLEMITSSNEKLKDEITNLVSQNGTAIIDFTFGFASSIVAVICNFFIGLVFAIYILMDKETLSRQFKKIFKRFSSEKVYHKIIETFSLANRIFSNYVKVQIFEAMILGLLCFVGMFLIRLPYAATISVLVGVTALVPVFGAFIGCFIGAFLIFMISPVKALTFIIFFLILQQIEGNFIYPKVVGKKVGLPGIWVLAAVTIGGSLGGILGMLIGVPVVSVLYSLLRIIVNEKTEN